MIVDFVYIDAYDFESDNVPDPNIYRKGKKRLVKYQGQFNASSTTKPAGNRLVEVLSRLSQNLKRPAKMETTPERAMMKVQTPSTRLMSESPKERMPKWRMLEAVATKPF